VRRWGLRLTWAYGSEGCGRGRGRGAEDGLEVAEVDGPEEGEASEPPGRSAERGSAPPPVVAPGGPPP
jgi:hypothetical protein